jgi:transcriptional regulator with XRE-family HTH domain
MLTLEEIRKRLQDRRLTSVSEFTGLHYNTVRNIAAGDNTNPTYEVLKALSDYLTHAEAVRG